MLDPGQVGPDGTIPGFHTPSLLGLRLTAPFFHDGSLGDPTAPSNFFSGSAGRHSLDGDIGAQEPPSPGGHCSTTSSPSTTPFASTFGFTDEELADIAEFLLSL